MMTNPLYLFSLDVLDTRLTPESQEKLNQNKRNATQSRWWTLEFFVYYAIFITVVPQMFLAAMSATNEKSVNYHLFEDRLEQGWIFGRKVDNSDAQYAGFRNKLPILAAAVILHYILRRTANALGIRRRVFDVGFAAIFLAVLHGFSTLKILTLYLANFLISKSLKKGTGMLVTWAFNIVVLFLNESYEGYKFGSLVPGLAILDGYCGLLPRWDVNFNFSVLRMISYNYDYYESLDNPDDIEKKQLDDPISEGDRIRVGPPKADYNFFNYLAYLVYTPLYIAGPILTFNDFIYQSKHPLPSVSSKRTLLYGLRVLFCILVMEWLLHYMYVVALSGARVWTGLSPLQISMVGFFNLKTIWLKLLIPWRFFRLWALLDEIDPPDNMLRCMSNNYSASAFWRSWHRSYNRWVTRYLYIPLGGAKHAIRNMLIVFTFVAVWHDIQLRLLAWGWLITLFVIPEVAAKLIFPAKKWGTKPIYRHMCAIGGVANIYMLMLANLVGFAVGLDGLRDMLRDIFSTWMGIPYFLFTSACLFVGVQVMFEVRAQEARQGINLRC
ncbi:MBOAT, membrane-bound O-acyltransferase family-domain-containing protein [Lipomyces orientalis]|uniref:MBOAT, membrane-bound O-acyltransferase family-domain-containing protein n=1 Tax=Lipomyces orientalis TaxID=1233043 RepID=A0ACC3TL68_9ASCO